MRFPLSEEDRNEMQRYQLRSACVHCFFYVQNEARCAHEWPSREQSEWPLLDATKMSLCKEFELR
ncbi:MAG: hypothetical protein GY811_23655 [Myxococcales bacterium]|nr:hypothetical protein [Myxococcales bacterium]